MLVAILFLVVGAICNIAGEDDLFIPIQAW